MKLLLLSATLTLALANVEGLSLRGKPPRRLPSSAASDGAKGGRRLAALLPQRGSHPQQHVDDAAATSMSTASLLKLRGGAVGIGGALSLLPPVTTLAVALTTKQVAIALLVGIWSGCMLLYDMNPLVSFLRTFDTHLVDSISDREHATVLLFNLVLGGTIGLVQKGGGAQGLAKSLKRFAKDARSCLATSASLAALIFFDDYASILIVGNSFRPLLPLLNVCKEKFAMLLHFVAVCVSASSPVSSWIGLQVGSVSTATAGITAAGAKLPDPFILTMSTLPYRFFPVCALAFVVALITTNKDFGPMADAVAKTELGGGGAASTKDDAGPAPDMGELEPSPGTPLRAVNALVPFGTIIAGTLGGMVLGGRAAIAAQPGFVKGTPISLVQALSNGDSVVALLWGSTLGMLSAMMLLLGQKLLDLSTAMETFVKGMGDVIEPIIVLSLAWALGGIITATGTADFIAQGLTAGGLPAWGLPAITTILSYLISFATGSSFGTMGILFPLIGPLAWQLGGGDVNILKHCFGCVLGGSLFGNVFSPIADTTILTQLATRVPLQDHVATTVPYAALIGILAIVLGDLPIGLGLYGPFVAIGAIIAAQTAFLSIFGKKPPGERTT
jgi:Na+/H+ antiporter NhaC